MLSLAGVGCGSDIALEGEGGEGERQRELADWLGMG